MYLKSVLCVSDQSRRVRYPGFTLPELLVASTVVPVLLSVGVVVNSSLDEAAGIAVSQSNLITLGSAHEMYSSDHDGKVYSLSPDDYGAYDGCADYINNRGCLDSLLLGWGESEDGSCVCSAHWGYWIDNDNICGSFGSCGNAVMITPIDFATAGGSFRFSNSEQINSYVNGRFYDKTFYAPLDTLTYQTAQPFVEACCGFTYDGTLTLSSYSFSPSAMWDPGVMRSNADGGFQAPHSYDESHRAPQVSSASHPELKTLLFEHNWNHGQPSHVNPNFPGKNTPYYFNHGRDATPLTLFVDGSVRMLPTGVVEADDARVLEETGGVDGLWHRGTPLGNDGYYMAQSYDGVRTSHNILTTDGIRGRDVLSAFVRDPDINGDGTVSGYDLNSLLGGWGADPTWENGADLNADGKVDGFDLTGLLGLWDG